MRTDGMKTDGVGQHEDGKVQGVSIERCTV